MKVTPASRANCKTDKGLLRYLQKYKAAAEKRLKKELPKNGARKKLR